MKADTLFEFHLRFSPVPKEVWGPMGLLLIRVQVVVVKRRLDVCGQQLLTDYCFEQGTDNKMCNKRLNRIHRDVRLLSKSF